MALKKVVRIGKHDIFVGASLDSISSDCRDHDIECKFTSEPLEPNDVILGSVTELGDRFLI